MKKRIFSWFLTLVMVLGMLPMTALAEEPMEVPYTVETEEQNFVQLLEEEEGTEAGIPFTAAAGDDELTVEESESKYIYTDWNNIEHIVDLYVVTVPFGSNEITLDFGEYSRLAYGYDKAGGYIASYGLGEDGKYEDICEGETTAVVTGSLPDYVQVQTPFDENWNSELLYAISFSNSGNSTDPEDTNIDKEKEEKINALLNNIAASYVNNTGDWQIMDMAAYEDLFPDSQYKTSDKAKKEYIDKAIASLEEGHADDITYSKAIICLTALGIDAEKLYTVNSNEPISAVEGLNSVSHSSSVWYAPYTMAAYNQKSYSGTEELEKDLIDAVLENQGEDGSWDEWGSVQSTSNVITGLSFYQGTDKKIEEAIENAVAYLCEAQESDGRFDDGYGPDANVAAMAVIGLCAAGVNPDTDDRFVKDDVSALDGLLSFALTDNSGFGYNDNSAINPYATEQAFRALIAAKQVMKTGKAFNIYDFSHNSASLTPGRATGSGSETKPDIPPAENDDITVDVTIRPDVGYWMKNKYVTVDEGATVYHAFIKALEGSGITQEGAESGYVSSMTYQGRTLGEFTLGENDGWLYKVNGELPDVGLTSYEIEDGDSILWYYTEDWTKDSAAGAGYREEIEEENQEAADKVGDLIDKIGTITKDSGEAIKAAREAYDALTAEQKELVENYEELLAAEEAYAALMAEAAEEKPIEVHFTDVAEDSYYYDAVQWAVANGITAGVAEDTFGPEWTCSRGQLATFLWRMAGSPAPETKTVPYIDVAEDSYYYDAILWAMENDIAKGTNGISFSPEMTVTRAQAVTFLWRAMGSPAPSGKESFGDVPETAYYHDAVLWATENGITSGTGEGMFSPDASCQRGQIVTFLYRAFGK